MQRTKMPRQTRAKQFAPFDALKGLQEALRLKEYEHERVTKGELAPEQANKISKTLLNIQKNDIAKVTYFKDGHYITLQGTIKLDIQTQTIQLSKTKISLSDIFDVEICS